MVMDNIGSLNQTDGSKTLSVEELLIGSSIVHDIKIPHEVLTPDLKPDEGTLWGMVRIRPLSISTLTLISRAAQDDISLVPLLMIKESVEEPNLSLDQIRQMHIGLVNFLINKINTISGLEANGEAMDYSIRSPLGKSHILLAKHFGWTPEQVNQLTPGQVAVYLAGIEKLLKLEESEK